MARAGLKWTLDDLATESGVNRRTILTFENGGPALESSIAKIRAALEARRVKFIDKGPMKGGVVLGLRKAP